MGTCTFCEREMEAAESCTKNVILYPPTDGNSSKTWRFAVPFGDERRGITDDIDLGGQDCTDCGVSVGGYHHPGCDIEESPDSGKQLLREVLTSPDGAQPYHARAQADSAVTAETHVL